MKEIIQESLRITSTTFSLRDRILTNADWKTSQKGVIDVGLSGKFLKEGTNILAKPISELCNLSIKYSLFPTDCQIAKLKPLFKKGFTKLPKNYRPISLLPLISQIIEKVIHNQTQAFLDENKIFYRLQSGFRKRPSTDSCLSYLNNKIATVNPVSILTQLITKSLSII